MAMLNQKIRAIYAGALGALGLAVGGSIGPSTAQSNAGEARVGPLTLATAAAPHRPAAPAPSPTGARSTACRAPRRTRAATAARTRARTPAPTRAATRARTPPPTA